jgi:CRISPR-associated protein Csb1
MTDETKELTFEDIKTAVAGSAAAFRCRRRLQPAGGQGDKVFPPTFAGAVYAVEQRRVPGREGSLTCVVLDTVQSQANRMELALQEAVDSGTLSIPIIEVDFGDHDPTGDIDADKNANRLIDSIGKVTSLQVPHRLADAILRDSEVVSTDGENEKRIAFRQSDKGKALNTVSLANATALFEMCPTALVFGMWDSTGPKGGLGPKFERALVSEVVGIEAEVGDLLRGVRRDPLEIRAAVKVLKAGDASYSVASADARNAVSPSSVNHSSVPFPKTRDKKVDDNNYSGVTVGYAEQTTTLSLICVRRLRFPIPNDSSAGEGGQKDETKANAANAAARTVLAALGLCSATLAFESGMGLRSRCLLWPDGPMEWELLDRLGAPPRRFTLNADTAVEILNAAIEDAKRLGLPWLDEPILLKPSTNLLELVRLSQLEATKERADEAN